MRGWMDEMLQIVCKYEAGHQKCCKLHAKRKGRGIPLDTHTMGGGHRHGTRYHMYPPTTSTARGSASEKTLLLACCFGCLGGRQLVFLLFGWLQAVPSFRAKVFGACNTVLRPQLCRVARRIKQVGSWQNDEGSMKA